MTLRKTFNGHLSTNFLLPDQLLWICWKKCRFIVANKTFYCLCAEKNSIHSCPVGFMHQQIVLCSDIVLNCSIYWNCNIAKLCDSKKNRNNTRLLNTCIIQMYSKVFSITIPLENIAMHFSMANFMSICNAT